MYVCVSVGVCERGGGESVTAIGSSECGGEVLSFTRWPFDRLGYETILAPDSGHSPGLGWRLPTQGPLPPWPVILSTASCRQWRLMTIVTDGRPSPACFLPLGNASLPSLSFFPSRALFLLLLCVYTYTILKTSGARKSGIIQLLTGFIWVLFFNLLLVSNVTLDKLCNPLPHSAAVCECLIHTQHCA